MWWSGVPLKNGHPKRKRWYSNHLFSGASCQFQGGYIQWSKKPSKTSILFGREVCVNSSTALLFEQNHSSSSPQVQVQFHSQFVPRKFWELATCYFSNFTNDKFGSIGKNTTKTTRRTILDKIGSEGPPMFK